MNCDHARNRILGLAGPTGLPVDLAGHLNGCSACHSWQQLLLAVDHAIVALPVPLSKGHAKRQLLEKFNRVEKPSPADTLDLQAPKARPAKTRVPVGERMAKLWPLGLVAAGLLVAVVGWSLLGGKDDLTPRLAEAHDPLLEKTVRAKVKLDSANSPTEKLDVLDTLAQDIHEQARTISKIYPGSDMESLARMYDQVVTGSIVAQARALTADERQKTLQKYIDHLTLAEQDANRLAAEAPAGSAQPLRDMAMTAQKSRNQLAQLKQGRAT